MWAQSRTVLGATPNREAAPTWGEAEAVQSFAELSRNNQAILPRASRPRKGELHQSTPSVARLTGSVQLSRHVFLGARDWRESMPHTSVALIDVVEAGDQLDFALPSRELGEDRLIVWRDVKRR